MPTIPNFQRLTPPSQVTAAITTTPADNPNIVTADSGEAHNNSTIKTHRSKSSPQARNVEASPRAQAKEWDVHRLDVIPWNIFMPHLAITVSSPRKGLPYQFPLSSSFTRATSSITPDYHPASTKIRADSTILRLPFVYLHLSRGVPEMGTVAS
ncbi:hypothetical protein EI94DRAFT_1788136 [Lactarius quietus]|nr:hypothetical protein EI94DRAFT_1788136 [Lactarius quietus]